MFLAFVYSACDWGSGGGGDDDGDGDNGNYNEATSLGTSLTLSSGQIQWQFDISDQSWTDLGGGTATDDDFQVTDEDNGAVYFTDDNTNAGMATVDINYTGTPSNLLSSSGWTGISSSDSDIQIATVTINVTGATYEEMAFCELVSGTPDVLQQYYYLYATGDVVLNGTYVDGGDTHAYNNIKFFEGWNQVIRETSDGSAFNYKTGTIASGQWTFYVP